MSEFSVRSDSVDVEQIMRQIRARIREKRGADYTEAELQQLASVKLETFLDPRGLRSDLVEQFRKRSTSDQPSDEFTESMLYETHRPMLRRIRQWLNPLLKLFINPSAVSGAIQAQAKKQNDVLFYEVVHNLVVEITRLGIEVHNLKMRVESMSSRLDFDERRSRSLEGAVQYRPTAQRHSSPPRPPQAASPVAATQGGQPSYAAPAPPPVYVSPSAAAAAVSAPAQQSAAPQSAAPGSSPAPGGRPDGRPENGRTDGTRPDGQRRRRRRRRRRPGQTMADGTAGAIGAGDAGSPHSGPADDGPDDDGADDQ